MRKDITLASGDHTGTGTLTELIDDVKGQHLLRKVFARIAGNAAVNTIGVLVMTSGLTSATAQQIAEGTVFLDAAVPVVADATGPDLNVIGTPNAFTVKAGESLYVLYIGDANPTSALIKLEIE